MSEKPYISNRNETVRLFQNPFLEYCSHIHPATPFVVFIPAVIYFLSHSRVSLASSLIGFVGGVLSWTLLEYAAHRFLFHFPAKSPFGRWAVHLMHGIHHDYPRDATRLVMPLLVSLPLAFTFYFLYRMIFGSWMEPVYAGLVAGYLAYDFTHFAVHHFKFSGRIFTALKTHHLKHHYSATHDGYGVSNPLWDFVFGTLPQTDHQRSEIENEGNAGYQSHQPEEAHAQV